MVIPHKAMNLSWGPTLEDLAHVRKMEMVEMVADQDSDSETVIAVNDDDDDDDDEEEEEEDGEEQDYWKCLNYIIGSA